MNKFRILFYRPCCSLTKSLQQYLKPSLRNRIRLATAFWPAIQQNAFEGGQSCAGPGHGPEYLRVSCCPVSHRQDISVFSGQDR